jgi:alpha-tubulin N-acetyltransferase 1
MSSLTVTSSNLEVLTSNPSLSSSLDAFGVASGIAQNLNYAITSVEKMSDTKALTESHNLYLLLSSTSTLIGYIKTGNKSLWMLDYRTPKKGLEKCDSVLSVLDFYVDENLQRGGYGRQVFELMLDDIRSSNALSSSGDVPVERLLAYDKPSEKMVPFLAKHYGLKDGELQSNNYVVYNEFWDWKGSSQKGSWRK